MTEQEMPLAPGEIYAYRFWKIDFEGHLRSVTQTQTPPWVNGENVAVCAREVMSEPRAPMPPEPPVFPSRLQIEQERRSTTYIRERVFGGGYGPQAGYLNLEDSEHPNRFPEASKGAYVPLEEDRRASKLWVSEAEHRYYEDLATFPRRQREYESAVAAYEVELAEFREKTAEHIAPMPDCQCGFYAVNDHETAKGYAEHGPSLLGVVQGYGKTQKYSQGWRFQKAKIVALAPWNFEVNEKKMYHMTVMKGPLQLLVEGVDIVTDHRMELVESNYSLTRMFGDRGGLLSAWDDRITR